MLRLTAVKRDRCMCGTCTCCAWGACAGCKFRAIFARGCGWVDYAMVSLDPYGWISYVAIMQLGGWAMHADWSSRLHRLLLVLSMLQIT